MSHSSRCKRLTSRLRCSHIVKRQIAVDAPLLLYLVEEVAIVATLSPDQKASNAINKWAFNGAELPRSFLRRLVKGHRLRRALVFRSVCGGLRPETLLMSRPLCRHGKVLDLVDSTLLLLERILSGSPCLFFEVQALSTEGMTNVKQILAARV